MKTSPSSSVQKLLPADFRLSRRMPPADQAIILLTRHSIREEAKGKLEHYKLALTKDGIDLAQHWGGLQKFPVNSYYSSPVQRCVDTAKHMATGQQGAEASKRLRVKIDKGLTEPGCFIKDRTAMAKASMFFQKQGPVAFVDSMLKGDFPHLDDVPTVASRLLTKLRSSQGEIGTMTVHVSHDTILATLVYYLMKKKGLNEKDWPRMMEGVYLWFSRNQLVWIWRGKKYQIPVKDVILPDSIFR